MWYLGNIYRKQRRYPEAERMLLQAYRGLQAAYGGEHARVRDAVKSLADLYAESGDRARETEWRAR
jgi:hypothetical protein